MEAQWPMSIFKNALREKVTRLVESTQVIEVFFQPIQYNIQQPA